MSVGSRVEVLQSAEELQVEDHVCTDSPKATEEQHEEEGQLPAVLGKTVTLEPVGKDKQHKRTEVEKSRGRRRDARGTNREQVIQADGAAADSVCSVERSRSVCVSRRAQVKHQRRTVQVHNLQRSRDKSPEEPQGPGPFFYFGGGNGASIVVPYCESKGWQRIYNKTRLDYRLKWCELKSSHTYYHFRAGEQLVFQIPNNRVLTTKIGLLNSLREYDRVISKINHGKGQRRLKMAEFIPDTFRMDVKVEKEAFFSQQEGLGVDKSNIWICKPTGLNQGRGIFLLHTPEDIAAFRARLQMLAGNNTNKKIPFSMSKAMIAQRYIENPLLLKGKKFDVRSYLLIACTSPYMVFFRHGYVRLTCDLYDPKSNNLTAHLTNQYMQKKNPLYSVMKEETVWSMERFNSYINEKFMVTKGLPRDWVLKVFTRRMQQIMTHCFLAVKSKLECKLGYFDLFGCDFLIDEDFKVWLLEMNCNPALHTNCEVLKDVVPSTVKETLDLTLEIFDKCRCGLKLLPLSSQRDFVLLHCGDTAGVLATKQRSRTAGPLRTVCSKQRSRSKKTQQAAKISGCNWISNTCPSPSLNISSNTPDASIHTSPPLLNLTNEQATSFTSASHLAPFSGSSFLLSSSHTDYCEVLESAQDTHNTKSVEFTRSQLQSCKAIATHMDNTWQQLEMTPATLDLNKSEHVKAKTAVISLSRPMLNDDSNIMSKLITDAGQAEEMDAQKEDWNQIEDAR
ncbi:hypothetical protein KOW79_013292 [Hemibagrus wyckioides]|uniref:Inactive polyglycylase TTLL10 n=2 Tax=Hemibagrus wyckioides TaxID=337641 RepID=A0A9D3NK62_9TELE|nr:hypothetical protein KOW79_013292 [Hemibagrus wyckioides]